MGEAKNTFELLLREHGASPIVAEAQYWIAEVLLEEEKYPEAIHEYQKVITLYPQSEVVDDAQYGIAIAHFLKGTTPKQVVNSRRLQRIDVLNSAMQPVSV